MSTPETSGSCSLKNKYSPFSSGINKSLLTPCRRVGLSRKLKTPVGNLKNASEESPSNNTNSSSIKSCSKSETTPVTHHKFMERKRSLNPLSKSNISKIESQTDRAKGNENVLDNNDIKSSKKELFGTFTSADLFDSDNEQSLFENETDNEDSEKTSCVENNTSNTNHLTSINSGAEHGNSNCKSDLNMKKRRLSNDINAINLEYTKNESNCQTPQNNVCNDFVNSKITEKKHKKSQTTSANCEQQCSSLENDITVEKSYIKNCKIHIQRLSEDEIKCASDKFPEKTSVKTLSKKCSSNISDDTDFFTSTPEEEKTKRKNLETKVKILERHIKEKQLVLENLQRASIYKSKHNIQDLKQLTSIWLEGCVQALKDLLTHLQAHGPIDLTNVLTNMRIPKEIVAKLPL